MSLSDKVDDAIKILKQIKEYNSILTYIPEHFLIEELVDPQTFKDRGQKAFELLDPYMLWTIDRMREEFGSITINTWKWGGKYKYSGYRPKNCTEGGYYSQHRLGRAFDLKFKNYTPDEIRAYINVINNNDIFRYINAVENKTPTWVHIDSRPIKDRIRWIDS